MMVKQMHHRQKVSHIPASLLGARKAEHVFDESRFGIDMFNLSFSSNNQPWPVITPIFFALNKKAAPPSATITLVTFGSPAFLESLWIRDFPPHPYGWFGFTRIYAIYSKAYQIPAGARMTECVNPK
jgi:hypothetical protein